MVLHTDEPHPHVHLVVKAVSEQGERLSISKVTLRGWREQFARHLRERGIAANATERAMRGQRQTATKDGIYRANLRGDSTYMHIRAVSVGGIRVEPRKMTLMDTHKKVIRDWQVAEAGYRELASDVQKCVREMSPPFTQREWIAYALNRYSR